MYSVECCSQSNYVQIMQKLLRDYEKTIPPGTLMLITLLAKNNCGDMRNMFVLLRNVFLFAATFWV